jgi:hypothetical protein
VLHEVGVLFKLVVIAMLQNKDSVFFQQVMLNNQVWQSR